MTTNNYPEFPEPTEREIEIEQGRKAERAAKDDWKGDQ